VKRALTTVVLLALAAVAGVGVGELLYESAAFRNQVGQFTGRGELLAITGGVGVYENDRAQRGGADTESLVIETNLRRIAARELVTNTDVEREVQLLRFQLGDDAEFERALRASRIDERQLRDLVADHLRARQWLERHIAPQLTAGEEQLREHYATNPEQFVQPQRYRARHLFVAAPEGTPPPLVEEKRTVIDALAARVAKGESLAALAAEASEDLATKPRGGDLQFFSASRVPEDFIEQVQNLSSGKPSAVVQTRLGFHILELTDSRPERVLPFDEVRDEISTAVLNERRTAAVDELAARLGAADFLRPLP
jgi:parvulin-like peptidyl-prolyl isomerase